MTEVGTLSIINTVATMLAQPFIGRIIDKFGKRPVIIFHYLSLPIVPLSYSLVSDFVQLAFCNLMFGIIVSAT